MDLACLALGFQFWGQGLGALDTQKPGILRPKDWKSGLHTENVDLKPLYISACESAQTLEAEGRTKSLVTRRPNLC